MKRTPLAAYCWLRRERRGSSSRQGVHQVAQKTDDGDGAVQVVEAVGLVGEVVEFEVGDGLGEGGGGEGEEESESWEGAAHADSLVWSGEIKGGTPGGRWVPEVAKVRSGG